MSLANHYLGTQINNDALTEDITVNPIYRTGILGIEVGNDVRVERPDARNADCWDKKNMWICDNGNTCLSITANFSIRSQF